ncbi:AraC family transcriptional regulator [Mycolicibacterium moriokaense]|uniref:AraC-like DNA-binding protein n=1 Tax=Mycolicibacterium moriokaense TaxID=39691 RepID=A0A318HFI1_9MYCO|nr:AraC family transcriptional regulator [Mycolicibacterium moriokaense]PXX08032.1 AraC-like DNA-binding protein [Mycolicibacterium moriokaense]
MPAPQLLDEIRGRIEAHARPDLTTSIDGLLLSNVATTPATPEYSVTHPLLVVMAEGGKRLMLGDRLIEYGSGDCLVTTANLPVTGHWVDSDGTGRALGMGLILRPAAIAELLLKAPAGRWPRGTPATPAIATGVAEPELLDAAARMLRLLDHPADTPVLAPLIAQEVLWRLLAGPLGDTMRQIGLANSDLSHVSRAIAWIRENYADPMRIDDLARLSGMSTSAFHRQFRAVTAMSPLQFQKRIRLQHARTLLVARPGDIAGIGHLVGYDSPSQFNREYRRMFGAPPGADAERLRTDMPMAASL